MIVSRLRLNDCKTDRIRVGQPRDDGSQSCEDGDKPSFSYFRYVGENFGAGDEIRTHDPNLGKVMLYP